MVKEERGLLDLWNLQGEKTCPRQRVEFGFPDGIDGVYLVSQTKIRPEMEFITFHNQLAML